MSETPHEVGLPPELNPRGPQPGARRRRRSRRVKVLSWLAVAVSLTVLMGSGAAYLGLKKLTRNIEKIPGVFECQPTKDNPCKPRPKKQKTAAGKVTNYLVIGSDSADGLSAAERKRLNVNDVSNREGARSDTMLLVHVPADHKGAYVLSFPRDLYVPIAGMGQQHKINVAFATGGPARAIQTVENLTNIRIDHYLEINVLAFANMVDGLAGVPICVPKAMKSKKAHLDIPAGQQTLDGPTALGYVRARTFDKTSELRDGTGDLGRIKRQQQFIGALVRRAVGSGLTRPDRLLRFLDRSTKALKSDDKLGTSQLTELASRFRSLDTKRVVFASVPIDNPGVPTPSDGLAATIDAPAAQEIFAAVANATILGGPKAAGTPTPAGPKLTVAPSAIRVFVRNGNGVAGQASTTATALRGQGFVVSGTGNADRSDYTETIVRHGPTRKESAQTLSAAIPGSRLELVTNLGSRLEVVVGANYTGVKAVVVTGRPTSPTKPKPPLVTAADDPCK